jgi:MoaA/NifB/PqqE/SkfB family radical SAM enzyme
VLDNKKYKGMCLVVAMASKRRSTQDQDRELISSQMPSLSNKLWVYTNFDCNLWCTYCVAESSPRTARRALSIEEIQQLVDEAEALGFERLFFTGGEPFILDDIYEKLAYASNRFPTTVLTNAMLFRGKRLQKLRSIANPNLSIQVSLDGAQSGPHDFYRGKGTWTKTVAGIKQLVAEGFHVCISTTETPANSSLIDELRAFVHELGIAEQDHFIRPLTRRGFSEEGMEVSTENLIPEVTVSADGVYWHPLVSPSDGEMLVSKQIFPLAKAVECIQQRLINQQDSMGLERAEVQ